MGESPSLMMESGKGVLNSTNSCLHSGDTSVEASAKRSDARDDGSHATVKSDKRPFKVGKQSIIRQWSHGSRINSPFIN
ncbi:hypothetical protein V6N13_109491 [Hibiscus sabdariffa]|uniref:Uncharacterized protein n=1 Tax=Hibiscus sabdariffa TaxID=183260 RepID=A0ABR2FPV1_9ROSI